MRIKSPAVMSAWLRSPSARPRQDCSLRQRRRTCQSRTSAVFYHHVRRHQEIIGTRFQRRHAAAMIGIVAVQVGDEWASINEQYRLSRSLNRLPPWPGTEICPWTVEGAQLLEPASRPFHQPKRMLPQAIDEL